MSSGLLASVYREDGATLVQLDTVQIASTFQFCPVGSLTNSLNNMTPFFCSNKCDSVLSLSAVITFTTIPDIAVWLDQMLSVRFPPTVNKVIRLPLF